MFKKWLLVKVHKIRKNNQLNMYNSKLQGEKMFNLDFMGQYENFKDTLKKLFCFLLDRIKKAAL